MLRQIELEQLQPGMYVGRMDGAWLSHPFWRSRFLVRTVAEIDAMRAAAVERLWIDTRRGKDIEQAGKIFAPEVCVVPIIESEPAPAPNKNEDATKVAANAKRLMSAMFSEARSGGNVNLKAAVTLVEDISDTLKDDPSVLLNAVRIKTPEDYTPMHSVAVCALMVVFCRWLGFDEEQAHQGGLAGLMHDIGKANIRLAVLNKPGALDEPEWSQMRQHPTAGYGILRANAQTDTDVLDACLHHHEKFDGSGYPDGLKGTDIARLTRMVSLCDVFDAVTSDRPYKRRWDPAEALHSMATWTGHFDPALFEAFVRVLGVYPVGSFVRLASQRLGVVCQGPSQTSLSSVKPTVRVVYCLESKREVTGVLIDLADGGCDDRIIGREDRSAWPHVDTGGASAPAPMSKT